MDIRSTEGFGQKEREGHRHLPPESEWRVWVSKIREREGLLMEGKGSVCYKMIGTGIFAVVEGICVCHKI